jgi:hypothetical protein
LVHQSGQHRLSVIHSVEVSYTGGPILRLTPAMPPSIADRTSEATRPIRDSHFSDNYVDRFGFAVARGGCFELKARLLADKTPSLQKICLSADLSALIEKIAAEYADVLTEEDAGLLGALPGLRNKLFHLELSRVTGRIKPLTDSLREAGVVKVNLETGESVNVASTRTAEGRIFGWLVESTESGALTIAADKFLDGVIVLERLMVESDRRMSSAKPGA